MHPNQTSHTILGVVFDWAGTAVDFGSQAPVRGLQLAFENKGVTIKTDEVRKDMGLAKPDHIRKLLAMARIRDSFQQEHNRLPTEADVQSMATDLERALVHLLPTYSVPVPGAVETLEALRSRGIRIGSTTGYSSSMMELVTQTAAKHGYCPEVLVTPDEVPMGRPQPWMCYLNAIRLQVSPLWRMVKVGDTRVDVEEGRNAGMWTVAVVKGSSELGLSKDDMDGMEPTEVTSRMVQVRERFTQCGADFVVETVLDVVGVIDEIETRLAVGDRPHG